MPNPNKEVPPGDEPQSINEPPGSDVYGQLPPRRKPSLEKGSDPDELEAELEDAEDDGDVETRHNHKTKQKKR